MSVSSFRILSAIEQVVEHLRAELILGTWSGTMPGAGQLAHITWDAKVVVRRVLRWVSNVKRGKQDRRRTNIKADFVEGGTIGPAKQHPRIRKGEG